jgi:phosphoglycerate dehydrogenase-like enzyme
MMSRPIAVAPDTRPEMYEALRGAVLRAGADLVEPTAAEGLIWADPARPDLFPEVVAGADCLTWVQLPYAGIEPFASHLDSRLTWTCGKGIYAPAVAETVMALLLAGCKNIHRYARSATWTGPVGRILAGSRVTVLGGGGITGCLLPLLAPYACTTTVVRRTDSPFPGADLTVTTGHLDDVLPDTDLLVLALSLTAETTGIIDSRTLALLPDHAWVVNVARGGHIVTDDLVTALVDGAIGGAALDVTDPEPLPDGHPLWSLPNCLITPHVANTPEMGLVYITDLVEENVRRFLDGRDLLALVDVGLGY